MTWGMVAVGVGTAAAGYFGSQAAKKAGKPTKGQQELEQLTASNVRAMSPYGLDFLKQGSANMKTFNDFYRKLALGDRSGALALLAPELRMADEQNAAALGSELTLNPRGGGSAERRLAGMDALKSQRADSILNLRTSAVDTLGAFGGEMAGIGAGLLGQSNSGGLGLLGAIQNRRNSAFDQNRALGQSVFEIMKMAGNYWGNRPQATATTIPQNTAQWNSVWANAPGSRPG